MITNNEYKNIWQKSLLNIQENKKLRTADKKEVCKIVSLILQNRTSNGLNPQEISMLALLLYHPNFSQIAPQVFSAAKKLREVMFGNNVVLMAPVEISSYCMSDCEFCNWRLSNKDVKRLRQDVVGFTQEIDYLLNKNLQHIEIASGDDLSFLKNNLVNYINIIKSRAKDLDKENVDVSICTTPLLTNQYLELKEHGLDCVLTWQETYNEKQFYSLIKSGPKRNGITDTWKIKSTENGYMFRLISQEKAINAGLQVGIGSMLKNNLDLPTEVCSTIFHAKLLLEHYPDIKPIIFGMPVERSYNNSTSDNDFTIFWKERFPYIACLYLLSLPNYKAWPFPNCRVSKDIQIETIKMAGCFSSTEVSLSPGGYKNIESCHENMKETLDYAQFTHYSHSHDSYVNDIEKAGCRISDFEPFV